MLLQALLLLAPVCPDALAVSLAANEKRSHVFELRAGDALDAVVEQDGIDVVVELADPDGKTLVTVDSPNGKQGPEPVLHVAERAGKFELRVRSFEADAASGRYKLCATRRPATPADRALAEERRELALGWQERTEGLKAEPGAGARYEAALRATGRALALRTARAGANHLEVADVLDLLGYIHDETGEYAKGREDFERAVAIRRAASAKEPDLARSESDLAWLELMHGEASSAAARFRSVLSRSPDRTGARQGMARSLEALGETDAARELASAELAAQEKQYGVDSPRLSASLSQLARLAIRQGKPDVAAALVARLERLPVKGYGRVDALAARSAHALERGEAAAAEALAFEARGIIVAAYGREHPAVCRLLLLEARAFIALKRPAEARERLDFAEALATRYLASGHPVRVEILRIRAALSPASCGRTYAACSFRYSQNE